MEPPPDPSGDEEASDPPRACGPRPASAPTPASGQTPAFDDAALMRLALAEAELAGAAGDVPVGAVVVDAGGNVIGSGRNRREADQDPTAHAEIVALRAAAAARGSWRLCDATLFVTLEPCPMCAGALVNARIARLVYGCADPKAGAVATRYTIGVDGRLNHTFAVQGDVLADPCAELLRAFFRARR
jgi:tRNA(adenine34) deaminase